MAYVREDSEVCFYPEQTSCAQHHSPNFTLNDIDAVSSPLLSSLGYLPLPVLFNATSSLPMTLPNALSPPDGGNGPNFFSFSAAGAPSPGAADYKEATQFNILNSAIGDQLTAVPSSEDEPSLAVAGIDTAPEGNQADAPTVLPQAGPVLGEPSTSSSHGYRRLSVTDQKTVDKHLQPCQVAEKNAYKCIWPNCSKKPFKRRCSARTHVHKHLGDLKLFECVACLRQRTRLGDTANHKSRLSLVNIAKRHSQGKITAMCINGLLAACETWLFPAPRENKVPHHKL